MRQRIATVCAALLVFVLAPLLASSSPAAAAGPRCKTASSAYLISLPSGTLYFSGFDGSTSGGIPVWTTRANELHQFGGNGIMPGTSISWSARNHYTGQPIDIQQWDRTAGSNCVVNQGPSGGFVVTAPPGVYDLSARYTGGKTGDTYEQIEVIANVVP